MFAKHKATFVPDGELAYCSSFIPASGFVGFDFCTGYAPDCVFKAYCSCLEYWNEGVIEAGREEADGNDCRALTNKHFFVTNAADAGPPTNTGATSASVLADDEDVLQEGFIKVFTNLQQYKQQRELGAWFRRIIAQSSIDYV